MAEDEEAASRAKGRRLARDGATTMKSELEILQMIAIMRAFDKQEEVKAL